VSEGQTLSRRGFCPDANLESQVDHQTRLRAAMACAVVEAYP
jgi:hypothetical protein